MDISFSCTKCGQKITIDETGAGQLVDCPQCGIPLEVPYKSEHVPPPPAPPREKRNPRIALSGEKKNNPVVGLLGLVVVGAAVWFYFGGGLEQQAQKDMKQIEQNVATDAVNQYGIAKRSGSAMDAYVHAGIVAAAYLQAKDEANYQKWKQIEAQEAARAGVPAP